jgi:hypothetical protein
VDYLSEWTIWGRGPFEGVDHLREWTIWGSGPFEGVDHLKEWTIWESGPLREWTIWGSGPFEGVDHLRECISAGVKNRPASWIVSRFEEIASCGKLAKWQPIQIRQRGFDNKNTQKKRIETWRHQIGDDVFYLQNPNLHWFSLSHRNIPLKFNKPTTQRFRSLGQDWKKSKIAADSMALYCAAETN